MGSKTGTGRFRILWGLSALLLAGWAGLLWLGAARAFEQDVDSRFERTRHGSLLSVRYDAAGTEGWAVGERGLILGTTDGGATWTTDERTVLIVEPWETLHYVHAPESGSSWKIVGDAGLRDRFADVGEPAKWRRVTSYLGKDNHAFLRAAIRDTPIKRSGDEREAFRRTDAWIAGAQGRVFRVWQHYNLAATDTHTNANLWGIQPMPDGENCWAVGDRGTIVRTRDTGATWEVQPSGTSARLLDVFFLDDGQRGWAVGEQGVILRTHDGGERWTQISPATDDSLVRIRFLEDAQRGWAVGENGTILHSDDGGQRWVRQSTGTGAHLADVQMMPDGKRGSAVGAQATILTTQDGGVHWQRATVKPPRRSPWEQLTAMHRRALRALQ